MSRRGRRPAGTDRRERRERRERRAAAPAPGTGPGAALAVAGFRSGAEQPPRGIRTPRRGARAPKGWVRPPAAGPGERVAGAGKPVAGAHTLPAGSPDPAAETAALWVGSREPGPGAAGGAGRRRAYPGAVRPAVASVAERFRAARAVATHAAGWGGSCPGRPEATARRAAAVRMAEAHRRAPSGPVLRRAAPGCPTAWPAAVLRAPLRYVVVAVLPAPAAFGVARASRAAGAARRAGRGQRSPAGPAPAGSCARAGAGDARSGGAA
jgi:hypothetical protein